MPGVPSSVACDGCRKLKKRCDLTKPSCLRCTQRGIPCVGNGVKRWKFMSSLATMCPRPTRCPSNETTRTASAVVYMMRSGDILWESRAMGGQMILDLIRRLGTSPLLDASISALIASFHALHHEGARQRALLRYGNALGVLRVAMQDAAQSIPAKIYSILVMIRCQDWIDSANRVAAPHNAMLAFLLQDALLRGKVSDIDPDCIYPLCQTLVWEAWINPRVELSGWFWRLLHLGGGPRPHAYQQQQPFLSLDVETHAEAAIYLRDPQRYLHQLQRIYQTTMAEKPKMCLLVDRMLAAELLPPETDHERKTRLTNRVSFQFGYATMILLASKLSRAMQPLVHDPTLTEDMHQICDDAIQISASCANLRPLTSYHALKVLSVVWACLPDADDYRRAELEEWMVYFQSAFEGADYIKEAGWMRKRLDLVSGALNRNLEP